MIVATAVPLWAMRWRIFSAGPPMAVSWVPSSPSRPLATWPITSGWPGASRRIEPFSTSTDWRTWQLSASATWARRWRSSPCTGTAMAGFTQRYISASSSRAGWPETCTKWSFSVTISTPRRIRALCSSPMACSLPGMMREEKMHGIARLEADIGMLVAGDAGQGRARLALAAGADHQHPLPRQMADILLRDEIRQVLEISRFLRRLHHAPQRAAHQADMPAMGEAGLGHALDARDIGGEAGDGDAVAIAADELVHGLAHLGLGARAALDQDIGGIADHGQHPLAAQAAQRRLVGDRADDGIGVELPIAGMQDVAERACAAPRHWARGSNG